MDEEGAAVMRIAALLSMMLIVAGCASHGAAWISASKFDHREYRGEQVAIVPVVLQDLIDPAKFPGQAIQDAIADQLYALDIDKIKVIEPQEARELSFPYTPGRLAKFGKDHGYRAVVGATMIRLDQRPARRQWSLTGNVTFVDADNPDRRWTIAKTWDMSGNPWSRLTALQLGTALAADFAEVRRAVRRGSVSVLMRRDTVVVDAGPIVNLDVVDVIADESNAVKQLVRAAPDGSVTGQGVQIDVFAMDDAGIDSLQIVNTNAGFDTWVWGAPHQASVEPVEQKAVEPVQKSPMQKSAPLKQPIYVAHRVAVEIAGGTNNIQAIATNGKEQRVARSIRVHTEVSEDVPIDLMVIEATQFGSLPPVALSAAAKQRFDQLAEEEGGSFGKGARVVTFAGEYASRSSVLRNITLEWARPAAGARRVLSFIGRAELFVGRPFFLLYDAEQEYPQIGSLSVDDLLSVMDLGVASATLDLCTNESSPAALEVAIRALGNPRIKVAVSRDCGRPVGQLFVDLESDELDDD